MDSMTSGSITMGTRRYMFGKNKPRHSLKTLLMSNYADAGHLAFPAKQAWERREISTDPLGNDMVGDCAEAAPARAIMNMTMVAKWTTPTVITAPQVVQAYSDITGYDSAKPETDQGSNMLDVCQYLKTKGMGGFTFDGYVKLDHSNIDQIRACIYIFGWVYGGIVLPKNLAQAISGGNVPANWDYDPSDGLSNEGHAISLFGYGRYGFALNSWGMWLHMDNDFWLNYVDEAYALVSKAWLKQSGISPSGFDYAGLLADLSRV